MLKGQLDGAYMSSILENQIGENIETETGAALLWGLCVACIVRTYSIRNGLLG